MQNLKKKKMYNDQHFAPKFCFSNKWADHLNYSAIFTSKTVLILLKKHYAAFITAMAVRVIQVLFNFYLNVEIKFPYNSSQRHHVLQSYSMTTP